MRNGTAGTNRRWSKSRVALLVVTGASLYLFAPSLAEVFSAWDRLGELHPLWVLVVLGFETASFACVWELQRLALRTDDWFSVITTQLVGNAFNRITPGGGATGTALQARMLADSGVPAATAATALTAQSLLLTGAVFALPVLSVPAIALSGTHIPSPLFHAAILGGLVFVIMAAVGAALLLTRRPLCLIGQGIELVANRVRPRQSISGLGDRLLAERDLIRETLGSRWVAALAAAVGRWLFEYLALLVTLHAISAKPQPLLVLFAFVAASVLSMIPLTPGGLGFVEAGLTATLAVAGTSTNAALLATLVFRLVSFWLPLPVGAVALVVYRRRYSRS